MDLFKYFPCFDRAQISSPPPPPQDGTFPGNSISEVFLGNSHRVGFNELNQLLESELTIRESRPLSEKNP